VEVPFKAQIHLRFFGLPPERIVWTVTKA